MARRGLTKEFIYSFVLITSLSSCGIIGNEKFEDLSEPVNDIVELYPATVMETDENRRQAEFNVVLKIKPLSNVEIPILSSDEEEGEIDSPALIFTKENWAVPQTVTITGVDDDVVDGDQSYTIITGPGKSEDPDYEGFDPPDMAVINHDNDSGNDIEASLTTEINLPPVVMSVIQRDLNSRVELEGVVTDDQAVSDILFKWEVDGSLAGAANPVTIDRPEEGAVITLTASDKAGASASYTFFWGRDVKKLAGENL